MRLRGNRGVTAGSSLVVLLIAGLSGQPPAQAADLYVPRGPAPEMRVFDATPWTGAYVGLSLGRSWGSTKVDTGAGNFTIDTNGGQYGGYAGYAWQSGMFVMGAEAELSAGRLSGSNGGVTQDLNWMGAVRARAGVLVAPALYVYGMAGLAWADLSVRTAGFDRGQSFGGFQLGAGAEYRLSQSWGLRVDYIHTGLSGERRDFPTLSERIDPDFHTVRAGLSFKF